MKYRYNQPSRHLSAAGRKADAGFKAKQDNLSQYPESFAAATESFTTAAKTKPLPPAPQTDRALVLDWLERIGEHDAELISEVIEKCTAERDMRRYFAARARIRIGE